MIEFTKLFIDLEQETKTSRKISRLQRYFKNSESKEIWWCIALFTGKRPKRLVSTSLLKQWTIEKADIPEWLFNESYQTVGDLAETIALLVSKNNNFKTHVYSSLSQWMERYMELLKRSEEEKKAEILNYWDCATKHELLVFNKIITGGFRVGVSEKIIYKSLASAFKIPENEVIHRCMGNWHETTLGLEDLLFSDITKYSNSKPYPFCLAHALDILPQNLENIKNWIIEYKMDGIRGQLIVRNHEVFLWSRGEELVTNSFPEFKNILSYFPKGIVLDGEIVAYKEDRILPFTFLQKRLGRKTISKKMLSQIPVVLICYDILELNGVDIRQKPLYERKKILHEVIQHHPILKSSKVLELQTWEEVKDIRENSKEKGYEGLMIKQKDSPYESGRKKGIWWKWKVDPYTIDAVLTYAQKGHGKRATLFSDYTFGIWNNQELVTFAKAYSGLTNQEIKELDAWIKKNSIESFGPVKKVKPEFVFEIGFESIQISTRHKSGIAVRFPRILRWRKDKKTSDANTLQDLMALIPHA